MSYANLKKYGRVKIWLCAGLFISLCAAHHAFGAAADAYKVAEVIDGDTIELSNGRHVRYLGIDTPEVRKRDGQGWKYAPESFAEEAKSFNRRLVSGKTVTIEFDRRREDKYGRWLGYVYVSGVMVNEEMLRSGFAVFTLYPPNSRYVDRLLAAQAEAQQAKRGIWSDCPVIAASEAADNCGKVVRVRGNVVSVGSGKNACFLNFGKDRGALTAVIWESNIPFFLEKGSSPPDAYRGKTVEITGKIKNSKGPEMVLFHPSQITIIEKQP